MMKHRPSSGESQASRSTQLRQLVFGGTGVATTLVTGGAAVDTGGVVKLPTYTGE
jgi:hypothetical protein